MGFTNIFCSMEDSSEIDQLKRALEVADSEKRDCEHVCIFSSDSAFSECLLHTCIMYDIILIILATYPSLSQLLKLKLDALSLDRSRAFEEVNNLQMELATLRKEQEDLTCRIKEQEQGSNLSTDLQVL